MANGTLRIPLNKRQYFTVTGGPYWDRPKTYRGVKMAAEIHEPYDVSIPTRDFQVPDVHAFDDGLKKTVDLILAGEPIYVGCAGGIGRTGLLLAGLAKAFGVPKPVDYVRQHYFRHAVETNAQMQFIARLEFPLALQKKIARARRLARFAFWRMNLTRMPQPVPRTRENWFKQLHKNLLGIGRRSRS